MPTPAHVAADELLVSFRGDLAASVRVRVRSKAGVTLVGSLIDLPVDLVRVDPGARQQAIARLRRDPEVISVQPDTIEAEQEVKCPQARSCSIPDDPGFPYQWYLYNAPGVLQPPGAAVPTYGADVDAPSAWSRTLGSDTVRIAILDTGIDATQPDLAGKVIAAANFTASNTTSDLAGHGTHVAGIAAAGDQPASFSNRSADWVDVAAPGVGIVSTLPTYDNATGTLDYGYLSGTSMSAPVVSGIAALIWGQMPAGQTNLEVKERIFATAQPVMGAGSDWDYGRADACVAVTADSGACLRPPPATTPILQQPVTPIVEQPEPAPSEIAQPAPIQTPPTGVPTHDAAPANNAIPGTYIGSRGRRGGPLRLTVADSGNALIGFKATVPLRCNRGLHHRVRVSGLSSTDYGPIGAKGTFRLGLRRTSIALRGQSIRLAGSFDTASGQASGTLRITGRARPPARKCDSRTVTWSAHLISR